MSGSFQAGTGYVPKREGVLLPWAEHPSGQTRPMLSPSCSGCSRVPGRRAWVIVSCANPFWKQRGLTGVYVYPGIRGRILLLIRVIILPVLLVWGEGRQQAT